MKKPITVLHVLNTGSYSGAENVVITIINNLKEKEDIKNIYLSLEGSIKNKLEKEGIEYYPIKKLSIINLHKAIKKIKPDIIHAHDYTATIISALCFSKAKIISHIHNNSPWIKKRGVYSYIFFLATLFCKKILTVSDSIEKEYVFGKYINKKIECIGNPIDIAKINVLADEYEEKEIYDMIFIGRITEPKNPKLLLNIIKDLIHIKSNVKIAIVGSGDMDDVFKEYLKNNNLLNNVEMFGFIENPYPILKKSKVMCLPSKWEGYGLVAVEALALGIPVVCSGAGGLKDIVDNNCGKVCYLKKSDYVKEIEKLLTNTDFYKYKSNCAIKKSIEINNIVYFIDRIYQLYRDLNRRT